MILNNKYSKCYYNIINRAKSRNFFTKQQANESLGYVEKHHILPKKLGGTNDKSNLVFLTAREHFICHLLLIKMTTGKQYHQMVYALGMMMVVTGNQDRYIPNSRTFETIKMQVASTISIQNSGKKRSQEFRKYMSKIKTGVPNPKIAGDNHPSRQEGYVSKISGKNHYNFGKKQSDESNIKRKEALTGISRSDQTKEKMRDSALFRPKTSCIFCHKTCSNNVFFRFHGNNCKFRPSCS